LDNNYVLASESCAFDAIDAEFVRDIRPGEIVAINQDGLKSYQARSSCQTALCIFEYVYFARPDSVIDGQSVYEARLEAGRILARENPVDADIVFGVPDSAIIAAIGYAEQSGIPYGEGLVKNRYIGRTFIQPDQSMRERSVSIKLNALSSNVAGKRVVMIDDSIVRGTTIRHLVELLRKAGAVEVHIRISSPPFLWPCYFGTDVSDKDQLACNKYTIEELRERIGADSLSFLPLEKVGKIARNSRVDFCDACFSGNYPFEVPESVDKMAFANN
jgi:amidophosphoribosyltransferase